MGGNPETKLLPRKWIAEVKIIDGGLSAAPDKSPGAECAINLIASVHQSHDSFHLLTQGETSSQDGLLFRPLSRNQRVFPKKGILPYYEGRVVQYESFPILIPSPEGVVCFG